MQTWRGVLGFCSGLVVLSCSGVQTGDSGDDGHGCDFREEPLTDLATTPEGFDRTPEEILRPATDGVSGVLTLEDGREVVVDIGFAVTDAPGKAVYRLETPGVDDCKAEGVTVTATMTLDGGALISATGPVEIRNLGDQFWVRGEGGEIITSESPVFEGEPLDQPDLVLPLQRDNDGTWRGDWHWVARIDCGEKELCSGMEEAPFGKFIAD